ncbi:MAG: type-F conjugative transfer system protein TraW [Legionellaceae bacterium]|nr:type-F conjugative transfer system protein TraW [Legionellaceae bacterium]
MKGMMLIIFMVCQAANAANLGVVGSTFPVAELSLMKFIESKLSLTDTKSMEEKWVSQVVNHANSPTPVGLRRAFKNNTYYYTPTIVLAQDLVDADNNVLWPKGTKVNALENIPYYKPNWLLFNADDAAQVLWVKQKLEVDKNAKIILTGGEVGQMEQELKRPIYFDQAGRITQQLGIRRVPVHVSRKGASLKICEVAIKEDGHEL